MANVFVTGVGRCGSVSFAAACKFMKNYTVGHETINPSLKYPDNHIEVNPHLKCCMHEMIDVYSDAFWVHLVREQEPSVRSIAVLDDGNTVRRFRDLHGSVIPHDETQAALALWYCYKRDIQFVLEYRVAAEKRLTIYLETVKQQWRCFWDMIKADGDYDKSLNAWDVIRNSTEERRARLR